MNDPTVIIFAQRRATVKLGLWIVTKIYRLDYFNVIDDKPYTYSKHIAPHDIRYEIGTIKSRWETAKGMEWNLKSSKLSIEDGIEQVRRFCQNVIFIK